MVKRHEQALFKGGNINGQKADEKVLRITSHQGNPSQNHSKEHFTPLGMNVTPKSKNECWWGCGENHAVTHSGGNVNWQLHKPLRKTVWGFLKNTNVDLPPDATIPLLAISKWKCYLCPMFMSCFYVYTHTLEYYSAIKNELTSLQ